jgi:hypothetical protein
VANGFGIQAFDCSIAVVTDCELALASLRRFLLPSLPRIGLDIAGAQIVIRVLRQGDTYQLVSDDRIERIRDFGVLAIEAVRLLDEGIVRRLKNLTAVHAGAVELRGRALLLPGGTHAGKSALVAELLRRGSSYLSDEYALIDDQGQAHAYPRPLLLRKGGPEQVPLLPEDCNAAVATRPLPVGWILALQYNATADWAVGAVPQSEGLLILLRNTPHELIESPRILTALKRAVASSHCYAGQRGGAADAAESILKLAAG